jgi:hypothetical protein
MVDQKTHKTACSHTHGADGWITEITRALTPAASNPIKTERNSVGNKNPIATSFIPSTTLFPSTPDAQNENISNG